jgi:predicted sugar kinase
VLPAVPGEITQRLKAIATERLVPAARDARLPEFSVALHEFNYLAGNCFAPFQHGAFASERLAHLLERVRKSGIEGVGQSSWGPTVFALTADDLAAANLVESLRAMPETAETELLISSPLNLGASIQEE